MASSIIRGKYVVTRVIDDNASEVIEEGAVFQRDGAIVDVGRYHDLRGRYIPDEVIGSDSFVVMPGLVNAHHHFGLTSFQMGCPDLPLEPWIVARGGTRNADNYVDTLYAAMQMIESGITTVMHNHPLWRMPPGADMREEGDKILKAYKESGMRVAFSFSLRDQNEIVYQDTPSFLATLPTTLAARVKTRLQTAALSFEEYLSVFADLYNRHGRNQPGQRIRHFLSPTNVQWCSDSLLQLMKESARRYDTGIHIHLQETIYQKMYGLKRYGKTPLAHLGDLGFLGPEVSCAHGVWLTESDVDLLAESGTCLCHNASSNLRLKSGIAPLNRLLARGVTVAIGLDEAGINDDQDILQEMRLVHKLHRVPGVDSPSPTSHQVLRLATVNGAQATFFADQVGTLEKGKRADIILVSLDHISEPYLDPDTNIVDAILYRGRGLDVDTVIVDGEVILKGRRFTRVDKEAVWAELKRELATEPQPYELERKQLAQELYPHVQRFYQGWALEEQKPHYLYNEAS